MTRFYLPRPFEVDGNGALLTGAKLYFYESGTTTPKAVYADAALTTPLSNPVVADAAGRFADIFLASAIYKATLTTSAGVTVWTSDPIDGRVPTTAADLANTSDAAKGDALIGVKRTFSGATATTLHAWLERADIDPVTDGGCAGDGVTDDAPELAALIAAVPAGSVIDGRGRAYKVNSQIALRGNLELRNMTLDFSSAANDARMLYASGTLGTAISAASGVTAGSSTITLSSVTGLAVDDYVWIENTSEYWDDWDDLTTMGEMHRIKSITDTTVSLYAPFLYSMGATGLTLRKISFVENLTLRNITAFGNGAGASGVQFGAELRMVKNLRVENCNFTKFEGRAFWPWRCLDAVFIGNYIGQCRATGTSYGIQIAAGCYYTKVIGNHFHDCRHGVDFGDNDGVSRYAVIEGNTCTAMRGSGLSTHTAADYVIFANNHVECDPSHSGTAEDGIYIRSINTTLVGNTVRTPKRYGLVVQNNVTATSGYVIIEGNNISGMSGLWGLHVRNMKSAGVLTEIVIRGNVVKGSDATSSIGIYVLISEGVVESVIIEGNTVRRFRRGIYTYADPTYEINRSVIANNIIDAGASGTEGIYVTCGTDGLNKNIAVTGNTVTGPATRAFRGVNEENLLVVGNNFRSSTIEATAANTQITANLL